MGMFVSFKNLLCAYKHEVSYDVLTAIVRSCHSIMYEEGSRVSFYIQYSVPLA